MKITIDKKKSAEAMADFAHRTSDAGKKAVNDVKSGMTVLSEKAKNDSWQRRLKKYNPVFPEQYNSDSFNLPNMISIVDDAVRKGIDVCEGSIGWLDSSSGMEVLHLYDEAVQMSGLTFVPTVSCDSVYYVDSFDRKRYINVDYIFSKAHEEKLAELKHIAYSLGARCCSIEICEADSAVVVDKKKVAMKSSASIKGVKISSTESAEQQSSAKNTTQRSGRIEIQFEGNSTPVQPELKWFMHDDNITRLIEMRCNNVNSVKTEVIELSGASSATMSKKTAYAIDNSVSKMGLKGSSAMESQAVKENQTKMIFSIEF